MRMSVLFSVVVCVCVYVAVCVFLSYTSSPVISMSFYIYPSLSLSLSAAFLSYLIYVSFYLAVSLDLPQLGLYHLVSMCVCVCVMRVHAAWSHLDIARWRCECHEHAWPPTDLGRVAS